jgi:RNA polymerase sigma-70 factor (ECF subfamily)
MTLLKNLRSSEVPLESYDALVVRAREGDRAAFQEIFESTAELIRRVLYRLLGPRAAADLDDLQQDVFVKMADSIRDYRGRGSFPSWVAAIAVNVARAHLVRGRIRQTVSNDAAPRWRE